MKYFLLAALAVISTTVHAESIFRIEVGPEHHRGSNEELQHRVWDLERAVWQLQQKVFNLENQQAAAQPVDSWVCTIEAMGDQYTGTGPTKALATEKSIQSCKKSQGDGFFCKNPKCEK